MQKQTEPSIELHSSDADTYLYLMPGSDTDGDDLYETIDCTDSASHRAQIQETLTRGTYTIEAAPWYIDSVG